jgi:hypothetical protein
MEAQLTEAGTFPAQLYANSFFAKLPTDARFLQCTYHKFSPASNLTGKTIVFNLEKFDASNIYLIQDTNLFVRFKITKANGEVPDAKKIVAPVNNVLHSLWSSVRLEINDIPITISPFNYPYKAYISNMLTYSGAVKSAQLGCQGWYSDQPPDNYKADVNNNGYNVRRKLFLTDYNTAKGEYRPEGATFFGRLMHDLVSCESGLPPRTKVRFELDRNDDEFLIFVPETDKEKYKIVIDKMLLYVPVAELSQAVSDEISSILTAKFEAKAISIHYRRIEIRTIPILKDKEEILTESLFADSDLPCRIVVAFVDTKSKNGDYHTNPFVFRRSWASTSSSINAPKGCNEQLRNEMKELRDQMKEQFKMFQEMFQRKGKGKGRGKTSMPASSYVTEEEVNKEAQRRLDAFLEQSGASAGEIPSDLLTEDRSIASESVQLDDSGKVYLKKIELQLNGQPIDQIEDDLTEDECIQSYWRLATFNGQMNSLFTNGISYTDFRTNNFMVTYDLSTSGKCGTNYVVPTIRYNSGINVEKPVEKHH